MAVRPAALVLAFLSLPTAIRHVDAQRPRPATDSAFVRWARAHATGLADSDSAVSTADLQRVAPALRQARVIALGEPTHGAHEPLALRNRLFRWLVEEQGFTAIALETGLPESRRIAEFVVGGRSAPPIDDAARVAREGMTWGFGNFAENAELLRWMRAWNDDPSHARKIRFYGIDLSLGGPQGAVPTAMAIDDALRYLARVDSSAARSMRAPFAAWLPRLPNGAAFSRTEHDNLTRAIDALVAQLDRKRADYVARSSSQAWMWARREAEVARQSDRAFRANPPASPSGGIPAAAWRAIQARDSAMAANVEWVLSQEGSRGRVLVYAHDLHVKNAPTIGGPWTALARPPKAMGQYLRGALGPRLAIVGMIGDASAESGDVERLLSRVGPSRYFLALRGARADAAIARWLTADRTMLVNGDSRIVLPLGTAFDAVIQVRMAR